MQIRISRFWLAYIRNGTQNEKDAKQGNDSRPMEERKSNNSYPTYKSNAQTVRKAARIFLL